MKLSDGHEDTHVPHLSGRSVIFPAGDNNGRRWAPDVWVDAAQAVFSRLMPLGDHFLYVPQGVWIRRKGAWSARNASFTVQIQDENLTAYPAGLDGSV